MHATIKGLLLLFISFVHPILVEAQSFRDETGLIPQGILGISLGASLVDINSDGLVDIFRTGHLYVQQPDGAFVDEFLGFNLEEGGVVFGAVMGDYNEDGFVDLFYMDLMDPSRLYQNRSGMGFVQSNNATGITDQLIVQGSLWTDFNKDGLLDLFVGIDGGVSNLFINGPIFEFSNINMSAGLVYQATYGVAAADYDRDGDSDIFLTQCFVPTGSETAENVLFENRDGMLVNVSEAVGIVDDLASWGTVWLDYNNDGWLDIYTVNFDNSSVGRPGINTLYRNNAGVSFTDVSAEAGVAGGEEETNVGVSAADFDNDGWIDLIVVSQRGLANLYRNRGDGTFEDIMPSLGISPRSGDAVAVADINNDGWIDLFMPTLVDDQLYINEGGSNHFLKVHTRGTVSNHFGIGARVDIYTNGMHQVREISAGDGMTSQNHNLSAHFGLGDQTVVDSLVIQWPSGAVDRLEAIEADQEITVVEQLGINNPPGGFALLQALETTEPDGSPIITFSWEESEDPEQDPLTYDLSVQGEGLDSTIQALTSNSLSLPGPLFTQGESYRWTVSASDGYSIRGTIYQDFTVGMPTDIAPEPVLSLETELHAYPNPFRTTVTITYTLQQAQYVSVEVYDTIGRRVAEVVRGVQSPGKKQIHWKGEVSMGTYMVKLRTESGQQIIKPVVKVQ